MQMAAMWTRVGRVTRSVATPCVSIARRGFSDAAPKPRVAVASKKKSKDARFVTVGLPLLLFVVGGYMTLTQVRATAVASVL